MELQYSYLVGLLFCALMNFEFVQSSKTLKEASDSVDKNALAKKINAPKSFVSSLSPFGLLLLDKTASTGLFYQMYNVSFASPEEGAKAHTNGIIENLKDFGAKDYKPIVDKFYKNALRAHKSGLTALKYFHVVSNVLEQIFVKEQNLSTDEIIKFIDTFVKIFTEEVHHYKVDNAKSSVMALRATAKRVFKLNGESSPDKVKHLHDVYADEFGKVGKEF